MSARSIRRNHRRELVRAGRRRAAIAVGTATTASLLLASGADAATFTVNQTTDAGDGTCDATCTLRDAVDEANANAYADTINFTGLTAPSTITLVDGQLAISDPVTITGLGASNLTIDQSAAPSSSSRVFDIDGPTSAPPRMPVSISGVTISGGYAGEVTGPYGTYGASGGGIRSYEADLTLSDVTLTGNTATDDGGGLFSSYSDLDITNSTFEDNAAADQGGGISASTAKYASNATITNVEISGNTVEGSGSPSGGGISLSGGVIADSEITGNEVVGYDGYGGGVELRYDATLTSSTVSGNEAAQGGGVVMNDDGALFESTVAENTSASDGGGVFVADDPSLIVDSTISGNTSGDDGGGIAIDGELTMRRSTVADNSADDNTGGIWIDGGYGGDPLAMSTSIVAGNTGDVSYEGSPDDLDSNNEVTVNSSFSLIQTEPESSDVEFGGEFSASNIVGADPQLGALGDNGGPTFTHLPAVTSPVIDAGVAGGATNDQRGLARPVDSAAPNEPLSDSTDMGAVEVQDVNAVGDNDVTAPDTSITSGPTGSGNPASVTFTFTSPDNTADFKCSLDGAAFASCTSPVTLSGLTDGAHVFQVRAVDPAGNIDATPATRTFVVGGTTGGGGGGPTPDARAPETAITKVPTKLKAKGAKAATAKLEFLGIDDTTPAGSLTFECKLDAGAYAPCSSPSSLKVKKGKHTFSVRAKDAAGNVDATPATTTFKVKVKKPAKK